MTRTKQIARKTIVPCAGAAGERKATAAASAKRGVSTAKTKAKASAKEADGSAVVVTTIRSAHTELVSTQRYATRALANAVVLKQWGAKTSGGFRTCKLFRFRKCVVSDEEGTVSTYEAMPRQAKLDWELEEEIKTTAASRS